ncbi:MULTISPECIES: SDR family NAD(P)-dependent oxidoreductase [unclassified Mesorhizobium]|uniref:SDR family NAD(P)-dependent oxidoreductase n=1 Tax=unclassified Mesorhizobium TaxID=325217 RepID=UPI000BB058F6|nr:MULTISPECIES: SDR family NAD(P)-dependent oxidoreductase [unclassified Mesorhizobium]TGT61221.1 SDR family NAD(P)-dependent oxidoreductase [Mesorhizobium sp. M00.F.Ca.ET.170.01.1.1]AZO08987.1 SDR family NAD(P)-dependent oxidoreductase [Mesorhizobium sp. M3A.F.Ca.ET.080.04.2.1]PBB87639.1 oxidoreductase [Mesorhizobium sp. WSM3876]RWB68215.1 MAG: SDR family NAD(P)-dependent oxidoreductase [Mesorhizobium sp.]RWB84541.1 MAG: SDR family NAD(P)-dependent oxidoreductase [Mesorhizobium sp.]
MTLDLSGRVALVTGASRGIGYFIAKELALAGAHVIAVARTVGGLEELDDQIKADGRGQATLVPLDLTDMAGIDRLGGAIHERWGKLDILVANAAILGVITPIGHVEAKTFEKVMTINVTSTWRLIRSVDPLLRLSDAGRAIIMSSSVAHSARPFWAPYAASKAAVEAMMRSWAQETESLPLRVNAADPGSTRTAMRAQAMPGEDPETLPHPAESAKRIVPLASPELKETGLIFQAKHNRFVAYRLPEPLQ